jgi:hypothetical protein
MDANVAYLTELIEGYPRKQEFWHDHADKEKEKKKLNSACKGPGRQHQQAVHVSYTTRHSQLYQSTGIPRITYRPKSRGCISANRLGRMKRKPVAQSSHLIEAGIEYQGNFAGAGQG